MLHLCNRHLVQVVQHNKSASPASPRGLPLLSLWPRTQHVDSRATNIFGAALPLRRRAHRQPQPQPLTHLFFSCSANNSLVLAALLLVGYIFASHQLGYAVVTTTIFALAIGFILGNPGYVIKVLLSSTGLF